MGIPTVKVKTDANEQGFYIMNEEDFDPEKHELYVEDDKGDGSLTVKEIKAALAEKGVEIPDGVTKKADLQALLDASNE